MKRAISIVATIATLSAATTAAAAELTVLILPDAYFPEITYLNSGDTVRFINQSGVEQSIISENAAWELGPIPDQGEVTMVIDGGVEKSFYNKDMTDENGAYLVGGEVSFSTAPLN